MFVACAGIGMRLGPNAMQIFEGVIRFLSEYDAVRL